MGLLDDAKNKIDEAKDELKQRGDDVENKIHEKKGEAKGRLDQAEQDAETR